MTKTGNGALQLAGTSTSVGAISVSAGELVLGTANYPNAQVTLATGTILDMRGQTNVQIGSIVSASSTATIKNFSPTAAGTLVTGKADGAFTNHAKNVPNLLSGIACGGNGCVAAEIQRFVARCGRVTPDKTCAGANGFCGGEIR